MSEAIEYHAARVLILLAAMAPRRGPLEGFTKLVKLDFLLRYPQFLGRLLAGSGERWPDGLEPNAAEQLAVDLPMIRYKYGPWDDRYYPILGYLIGTGLADVTKTRGTLTIRLTDSGRTVARKLSDDPAWDVVARRANVLRQHFGKLSGNAIKDRIYRELPDVVDRPMRTPI